MNNPAELGIDGRWIRKFRGPRNSVDPTGPCRFLVEKEQTLRGGVEDVITLFITGRECSYTCLMCDLWKNTTKHALPPGTIPDQIKQVLPALPPARHIKLYNSSSFFDPGAIPPEDYTAIAELVEPFETVIVENHPKLTGEACLQFSRMIRPRLQVAMGLETIHPGVLPHLNKGMTPEDFCRSVSYLKQHDIDTRAFILLKPPFMSEEEGTEWAKRSLLYAFECGTDCATVIPTRAGNGAMEHLQRLALFSPPTIRSLEEVLEYGIGLDAGPVFADTWDLGLFSDCDSCFPERLNRIEQMNLLQRPVAAVSCSCDKSAV